MASGSSSAVLALIGAALLWSFANVYMKGPLMAYEMLPLLTGRYVTAFILMYLILRQTNHKVKSHEMMPGIIIGALTFIGFLLNGVGLILSTPARASFLSSLSVLFVPVFSYFLALKVRDREITAAMIAFTGLILFTFTPDWQISTGEIALFLDNIPFALGLVLTGIYLRKCDFKSLMLVGFGTTALLSLLFSISNQQFDFQPTVIAIGIVSGIFFTMIPTGLQSWALIRVSPTATEVIISLCPVFTGMLSNYFLGETFSFAQVVGGVLIVYGSIYAAPGKADKEIGVATGH
ncbi:MAG: DMT family transporter [Candidatus Micrarchaeota archaeon]